MTLSDAHMLCILARGLEHAEVRGRVNNRLAKCCTVAAVIDLLERGLYYQSNFKVKSPVRADACTQIFNIKSRRSSIIETAWGILDPGSTGLALLGKEGLGTNFHVDRTQAEDLAFPINIDSASRVH